MNRKPTILRHWLATLLAAVLMAAAPDMAWGQTNQGVRVKTATGETSTNVKAVASTDKDGNSGATGSNPATTATASGDGTLGDGTIITAGNTKTVTVNTTGPRVNSATGKMQVAKVKVTKKEDFLATGITITSAEGDVTTMNGNATLQMTANFSPTYTDNKAVVWSVAPAPESSATATIDDNGLLTAGTVQGDVVVTATATNGTATTDDDKTDSKTITITTIPLDETSTTINVAAATYTGSALTPGVTVKYGTTDLVEGQDYTLGSWTNNTNAGTASVTITGTGAYSGSIVKNFTIARASWSGSISLSYTKGSSGNKTVHVQYNGEGSDYISKWEECEREIDYWNTSDGSGSSFDQTHTSALEKIRFRVTIGPDTQNHKQTVITSAMLYTP